MLECMLLCLDVGLVCSVCLHFAENYIPFYNIQFLSSSFSHSTTDYKQKNIASFLSLICCVALQTVMVHFNNVFFDNKEMEIELTQFQTHKLLVLKEHQHLTHTIKQLQLTNSYLQIFKLTQEMNDGVEKYLIATNALLHLKDWGRLIEYSDKGLAHSVQSQFYYLKGKALGKLGNNLQKIECIQKAIQLNPNIGKYHRNIGSAYYTEQMYDQAIKQQQSAISIQPLDSINHHNLGTTLYRLHRYQAAIQVFEKAIELNSKQALSYSWKGDCLKYLNKYEQALACYTKAYQVSSNPIFLRQKQKLQQLISQPQQQ